MELAITLVIIAILVGIAIPLYRPVHHRAMHQSVQANLRIIEGSLGQYAADHEVPRADVESSHLVPGYLNPWPSGPGQATYGVQAGRAMLVTLPWPDYDPSDFD